MLINIALQNLLMFRHDLSGLEKQPARKLSPAQNGEVVQREAKSEMDWELPG